jgi:hypothetical protein
MERNKIDISNFIGIWDWKLMPIDFSPNVTLGKWLVIILIIINGVRNSVLRPAYVLGKTHLLVRVNRRNRNDNNKYRGKDRRGSCDKGFPKYVRSSLYNISVFIMGILCFVEGTVKFCKQSESFF